MSKSDALKELLDLCKSPKTLYELESMTGVPYHTLWRHIRELKAEHLIKELPFRKEKKAVYQTVGSRPDRLELYWEGVGAGSVGDLLPAFYTDTAMPRVPRMIAGALVFTAIKSYRDARGQPGSTINAVEARRSLEYLRGRIKGMLNVIDQLLMSDIWKDNMKDLDKLLKISVDTPDLVELAVEWEHWWMARKDK